jgi:hypothetical protein
LRAVAWLAGNLARDQVGPLLPNLASASAPRPGADPAPPATRAIAATRSPASADPPALVPPPIGSEPARTSEDALSIYVKPRETDVHTRWWITASGGATLSDYCLQLGSHPAVTCGPTAGAASPFTSGSSYQLEVLHKSVDEGTIVGAALDTGPNPHLVGLAGLIGTRRPWGRWYLEATLGAGIEAERLNVATTTIVNSSATGITENVSVSAQVEPALYARATGSVGIPINRSLDLVARLTVHLASSGGATDFIGASAGLRLKLP